jgi:hypothetical protein
MFFRNQLKINNIKIKQPPFHSGYAIPDTMLKYRANEVMRVL